MTETSTGGAPEKHARFLNVALLVAGYGFGQGSIFLAQTWLLAHGQVELLALFGTHFAFAMLGIIVVDAGALTILARHAASLEQGAESADTMWRTFWETSIFRVMLAAGSMATALGLAALADEAFTHAYIAWAAPALLLWAVNAAGFLDGRRMSGISGLSGSIAYVASAIALMFAPGLDEAQAGALLGGAFTAGYLATVLVQFAALAANGWRPRLVRPTPRGIVSAAHDGLALLGGTLPGQLYFRAQLLICSAWLGPAATALLVYVRQIINAAAQLIGFIRRVEFPALVSKLRGENTSPAAAIWRSQRLGTLLSVGGTACLAVAGLLAAGWLDRPAADVGALLAAYAIIVALSGVSLGLSQGMAALGWYRTLSVWSLATTAVGLTASVLLVHPLGIYGFALADALSFAFGIAAATKLLRRNR